MAILPNIPNTGGRGHVWFQLKTTLPGTIPKHRITSRIFERGEAGAAGIQAFCGFYKGGSEVPFKVKMLHGLIGIDVGAVLELLKPVPLEIRPFLPIQMDGPIGYENHAL
ncbi:hypothetical protein D1872_293120 [compost metagenome]